MKWFIYIKKPSLNHLFIGADLDEHFLERNCCLTPGSLFPSSITTVGRTNECQSFLWSTNCMFGTITR